jgi:hypothetical protein
MNSPQLATPIPGLTVSTARRTRLERARVWATAKTLNDELTMIGLGQMSAAELGRAVLRCGSLTAELLELT